MSSHDSDWTEPGAFEVSPGIYRIPLPLPLDGLKAVNVYAITSSRGLVLIDGGWALDSSVGRLTDALKEFGASLADIERFLVTHIHRDHYTQAVAIRRRFGTHVSLGVGERPAIEKMMEPAWSPVGDQFADLRRCGAEPLVERLIAEEYGKDIRVEEYELPDTWIDGERDIDASERVLRPIPTPGHTQGHVVFIDESDRLLFSGDHVLPHITPSIGLEAVPGSLPLRDYLVSLRKMQELADMTMLPAHGPPAPSVHARVDELLDHHAERLDACRDVVAGGCETAYEAARVLRWTRHERRLDDLDGFNQMLAVMETAAHLDVLVHEGRLVRGAETDGHVTYAVP